MSEGSAEPSAPDAGARPRSAYPMSAPDDADRSTGPRTDPYAGYRLPPAGLGGPGAPVQYPPPVVPPGPRSAGGRPLEGRARVAVVAVGVVVLVAAVGLLVTRARGTDRSARGVWEATSLVLPDRILGIPRQPAIERTDEVASLAGRMSVIGAQTELGVYGRSATAVPAVVVVAGRAPAPMTAATQRADWDRFVAAMQEPGRHDTLAERSPGPLGGRAGCGALSSGAVLCLSIDPAALVAVVSSGDVPGGVEALAGVRETVEHRK